MVAVNLSVNGSRDRWLPYTKAKLLIIFNDKFRVEQFRNSLAAAAANDIVGGVVEYSGAPEQQIDVYVPSQVLMSANLCRSHVCNVLHCNLPSIAIDRLTFELVSKAADLAAENVQYHANMGFDIVAELEVIGISRVGDHVMNYASQFQPSSSSSSSGIDHHHNNQQQEVQVTNGRSLLRISPLPVGSSRRLKSTHEWLVTGNGKLDDMCSICLEKFSAGIELVRLKPCNHTYHPNCMLQWMLDNHNSCPMCRGRILRT